MYATKCKCRRMGIIFNNILCYCLIMEGNSITNKKNDENIKFWVYFVLTIVLSIILSVSIAYVLALTLTFGVFAGMRNDGIEDLKASNFLLSLAGVLFFIILPIKNLIHVVLFKLVNKFFKNSYMMKFYSRLLTSSPEFLLVLIIAFLIDSGLIIYLYMFGDKSSSGIIITIILYNLFSGGGIITPFLILFVFSKLNRNMICD